MKQCSVGLTSRQDVTDPDRHTVKESSLSALVTIMTPFHIHEELSQESNRNLYCTNSKMDKA